MERNYGQDAPLADGRQVADSAPQLVAATARAQRRAARRALRRERLASRPVISVREGSFHAWARTVAIVAIAVACIVVLAELAPRAARLLGSAETAMNSVDNAISDVQIAVSEAQELVASTKKLVNETQTMSDSADELVAEARTAIENLNGVASDLEEADLPKVFANLNTAIEEFAGVVGPLARLFGRGLWQHSA